MYSKAFQLGYIGDEKSWLAMIDDRNKTSHVYDQEDAQQILERIKTIYIALFDGLLTAISA